MIRKYFDRENHTLRKNVFVLLFVFFAASIFSIVYLIMTGNNPQEYPDILVDWVAVYQNNKTPEVNLVYILTFGGIALYSLYWVIFARRQSTPSHDSANTPSKSKSFLSSKAIPVVLGSFIATRYITTNQIDPIPLMLFLLLLICEKNLVPLMFSAAISLLYAVIGLYRLYVCFGGGFEINATSFAIAVGLLIAPALLLTHKKTILTRISLISQCFVPLTLTIFLANRYLYQDETMVVEAPPQVSLAIILLVIIFIIEAFFKLRKNWSSSAETMKIIALGTCISILAFNSFGGSGAIIPADIHHPYENIIGFSQIFELGQMPFEEYIPSSGLYSVVQGFFLSVFGDGQMGNYYITENFFYLVVAVITVSLLWIQSDKLLVLAISAIYLIPDYNRYVFTLPLAFLLICPCIISNRNRWLQIWTVSSLFLGLYYPICGVAFFFAFLPLAGKQLFRLVRSEESKIIIRRASFWIGWGICSALLLLSLPLLLGMANHILAMSGQSLCADGLARFGQMAPDTFLPYMKDHVFLRYAIYYALSFVPLAAIAWISYAAALSATKPSTAHSSFHVIDLRSNQSLIFIGLVLFLAVSYSYTCIRLDEYDIYARNSYVVFIVAALIAILITRCAFSEPAKCLILGSVIAIVAIGCNIGLNSIDSQLDSKYEVPQGYLYIKNDSIEKLGTGFMQAELYEATKEKYEIAQNLDPESDYLGAVSSKFDSYYLFNIKGAASLEANLTAKSRNATAEVIENVRANKAKICKLPIAVGGISPIRNYYLYRWLLTSGEYIWSELEKCFVPTADEFAQSELVRINSQAETGWERISLQGEANSLGRSIGSLEKIMNRVLCDFDITYLDDSAQINFKREISGIDADYLFLDFSDMQTDFEYTLYTYEAKYPQKVSNAAGSIMQKTYNYGKCVTIAWENHGEEYEMTCWLGDGKLLIPLGADPEWLLNTHSGLTISMEKDGTAIEIPKIKRLSLFKLQDAM